MSDSLFHRYLQPTLAALALVFSLLLAIWPSSVIWHATPPCYLEQHTPQTPTQVAAPDLVMLFQQGVSAVPSEDQLAEEKAIIDEQIEDARQSLQDSNLEERISGAEQLAAYPFPPAEQYLLEALKHDAAEDVRAAAASSLAAFKEPDLAIFQGLLTALQDGSEAVQNNAWGSLELLLNNPYLAEKTVNKVHASLRKLLKQRRLTGESGESVRDYLQHLPGR